jgi:hypothetical protein
MFSYIIVLNWVLISAGLNKIYKSESTAEIVFTNTKNFMEWGTGYEADIVRKIWGRP